MAVVSMLEYPHDVLQNHFLTVKEVKMQNKSWGRSLRLLRVAASSNLALKRSCAKSGAARLALR